MATDTIDKCFVSAETIAGKLQSRTHPFNAKAAFLHTSIGSMAGLQHLGGTPQACCELLRTHSCSEVVNTRSNVASLNVKADIPC